MKNRMTIKEASERMGVSQTYLREGLARNKFPFGEGFRITEGSCRRTFYINRKRFEKYMEGN